MSRRSNSRKKALRNEEDDDDYADTQSSQSSSRKKGPGSLSQGDDQNKTLISDVVNYVLGTAGNANAYVKKEDICKLVLKEFSRLFPEIFAAAKIKLESVYGLIMIEVPNHKNWFMVINKYLVGGGDKLHTKFSDSEHTEDALLFIILTLIFMNGNIMNEKELLTALHLVGINSDSGQTHDIFGDIHKLIFLKFVKRNYLKLEPIPNTQPVEHDLMWGTRAEAEILKMDILEAACKMYETYKPEQFHVQYKEAQEQKNKSLENGLL